jgi:hypothetical protein
VVINAKPIVIIIFTVHARGLAQHRHLNYNAKQHRCCPFMENERKDIKRKLKPKTNKITTNCNWCYKSEQAAE